MVLEVVYSVTDPPIKALRRVIPPLRIGSVALDLSFLIVLVAAYILLRVERAWCSRVTLSDAPRAPTATGRGAGAIVRTTELSCLPTNEWVRSCR